MIFSPLNKKKLHLNVLLTSQDKSFVYISENQRINFSDLFVLLEYLQRNKVTPLLISNNHHLDSNKLEGFDEDLNASSLFDRTIKRKFVRRAAELDSLDLNDRIYHKPFPITDTHFSSFKEYLVYYLEYYGNRSYRVEVKQSDNIEEGARILVDGDNLRNFKNGTFQVIKSTLRGLNELGFDVDIWCRKKHFNFHELSQFAKHVNLPLKSYSAVIHVGQPRSKYRSMIHLSVALRNQIIFLDTIPQDNLRLFRAETEKIWFSIAELYSDIIFISESAKHQYVSRYNDVPNSSIAYLTNTDFSCSVEEEISELCSTRYTLIIGNDYLHKGIHDAIAELPVLKNHLYVVQTSEEISRKDTYTLEPGSLSAGEIKWLYKNCLSVIYPTYREGFGLPIIQAAMTGKKIFVRKLCVFYELIENFDGIGDYINFVDNFRNYSPFAQQLKEFDYSLEDTDFAKKLITSLNSPNINPRPKTSIFVIIITVTIELISKGKTFIQRLIK